MFRLIRIFGTTAALAVAFFIVMQPQGLYAQSAATATPRPTRPAAATAAANSAATATIASALTPTPVAGDSVTKTVVVTDVETAQATPAAAAEVSTTAVVTGSDVGRQSLTIHFDDFDAAAELTYPSEGKGPFPTLVLIAGSGTEDMDASICSFGSPEPLSQNFRRLAEELPNHGIAVLRYNKHYVTGPCQADFMQYYANVDLPLLLEDAGLVLAAAQSNELVDSDEIYLYGWSEGSTIAAQLAISSGESIAGLVLQAPVVLPWYDTLLSLVQVNAGLVALGGLSYLADPQVMAQNQLAINPFFDGDENESIDIQGELLPNLRAYLDQLFAEGGPFAIYASDRALPTVAEQAPDLQLPLLILQGENDANVPAFGAQLLDILLVGNPNRTLLVYEGLGHSLGEATSVVADNFAPMADDPVKDLADWLIKQAE